MANNVRIWLLAVTLFLTSATKRQVAEIRKVLASVYGDNPHQGQAAELFQAIAEGSKVKGIGPAYTQCIKHYVVEAQSQAQADIRKGMGMAMGEARPKVEANRSQGAATLMAWYERLTALGSQGKGINKALLEVMRAQHGNMEVRSTLCGAIMAGAIASQGADFDQFFWGLLEGGFDADAISNAYETRKGILNGLMLWMEEDEDLLTPHIQALVEIANEFGHWVTLDDEMSMQHAVCPLQAHAPKEASTMITAKTKIGAAILDLQGELRCVLNLDDESRQIWAPKDFGWHHIGVTFMGSEEKPLPKAVKGLKYAKALVAPMAALAAVDITTQDCINLADLHKAGKICLPEAAVDGQVLITEALFIQLMAGLCRKKFLKKALGNNVFQVFIGRLFVPGYGLVKGGFMVVPTSWLNFDGTQYHIVHYDLKDEVVIDSDKAYLCASSNLKKVKDATTDLQNFLMSVDISSQEAADFFGEIIDTQINQRTEAWKHWATMLEEAADEVACIQDGADATEFASDGLKEAVVARVLDYCGYDVKSFPTLYVALMNMAGDGEFDPHRFRASGKVQFNDEVTTWRKSWYYQPHPGRTILSLEYALGKCRLSKQDRKFLRSWTDMDDRDVMVAKEYYDETLETWENGHLIYATRRPMTATGGVPMQLSPSEYLNSFKLCGFVKPTEKVGKIFWFKLDGADADDSIEENRGIAADLMRQWDTKKRDLVSDLNGEEVMERLKALAGNQKFFGLSWDQWTRSWTSDETDENVAAIMGSHLGYEAIGRPTKPVNNRPYLHRIAEVKKNMEVTDHVNPVELWTEPSPLGDIQAWTGSAANAQMFAMFVVNGFLFKQGYKHYEEARQVAAAMCSIMLSDVIDAQQQGNNVPAAADSMTALTLGMLMLSQWLAENMKEGKEIRVPAPMKARSIWWMKNLLTEETSEDGERELVGWRYVPVTDTVTGEAAIPNVEDRWEMFDHMRRYIQFIVEKVQTDLKLGSLTGDMQKIGRMAAISKEPVYKREDGNVAKEIGKAMMLRSKRSELISRAGLEEDKLMAKWAQQPLAAQMRTLYTDANASFRQMLGWVAKWEDYNSQEEGKELEVTLDTSTMKLKIVNGGSRTGLYGDQDGMPGLWRYFIKWLLDESKSDEQRKLAFYHRELGEDLTALKIEALACQTVGELMDAGFGLVNAEDEAATVMNRSLIKTRRRNRDTFDAYIKDLRGATIGGRATVYSQQWDNHKLIVVLD